LTSFPQGRPNIFENATLKRKLLTRSSESGKFQGVIEAGKFYLAYNKDGLQNDIIDKKKLIKFLLEFPNVD